MTIAAQLAKLLDALGPWAASKAGRAVVIGDTQNFITWLRGRSLNVGILFSGEDKRGELEEAGVYDRKFTIIITRSEGLVYAPGDALVGTTGAGEALFNLVEQARDIVRDLQFTAATTEVRMNYEGSRLYLLKLAHQAGEAQIVYDAYEMTFMLGTQQ
jgi:hypothetical protein